jgi:hypothetical protein
MKPRLQHANETVREAGAEVRSRRTAAPEPRTGGGRTATPDYAAIDAALDFLAPYGPDLANGMTSHAPMVAEAMIALDRAHAVLPWLEKARPELTPRPAAVAAIEPSAWRSALGREERFSDWSAFFAAELAEARWQRVLARWAERLAPGICAAATHGVLRAGHAARSLAHGESPARIRELADGLALWASAYQTLPAPTQRSVGTLGAREAIDVVPVVPLGERRFTGTIVGSLAALGEQPAFAAAIDLLDVRPRAAAVVTGLTETFARVFLANARDCLSTIVFVHGVTSAAALRSLLPHLDDAAARAAIAFAWQAGAGLYAAFATAPACAGPIEPPLATREELIDRAIASGDDHAIKLTEACLREHAIAGSPVYLAAAQRGLEMLGARD